MKLKEFLIGWRRRSAMILDYAGAPGWLIHWRCRPPRNWGTILLMLYALLDGREVKEWPHER